MDSKLHFQRVINLCNKAPIKSIIFLNIELNMNQEAYLGKSYAKYYIHTVN